MGLSEEGAEQGNVRHQMARIDAALEIGALTEQAWYGRVRDFIEAAYLASDNPQGQSGLGGDAAHWERRRSVLVEAIERDGAFLDVGCANGLLMETLVTWAAACGFHLEPYGLEISPKLAALARSRLPDWADRIFEGNVISWTPPCQFDYVFSALEYVPAARQPELVARLLDTMVAPGGRLVLCSYRERGSRDALPLEDRVRSWGFPIDGHACAIDAASGGVATRIIWLNHNR